MNTVHKLEIGCGMATLASVALIFFFALLAEPNGRLIFNFGIFFWYAGLFSLMVAAGSYYDAAKHHGAAVVVLAIGAVLTMMLSGAFGFFIFLFKGDPRVGWLLLAPAIFAFLTGVLAMLDRK
jgi:hypothetical protein